MNDVAENLLSESVRALMNFYYLPLQELLHCALQCWKIVNLNSLASARVFNPAIVISLREFAQQNANKFSSHKVLISFASAFEVMLETAWDDRKELKEKKFP